MNGDNIPAMVIAGSIVMLVGLFLLSPVYSYEINAGYNRIYGSSELLRLEEVRGRHIVLDNKDLDITITALIYINKRLLDQSDHIIISFHPEEWWGRPLVKKIDYIVSIDNDNEITLGTLDIAEKNGSRPYPNYYITVPVKESDFGPRNHYVVYTVELSYLLEDHIFKQGEFYVVSLNFPNMNNNMDEENLFNYLELPFTSSIPYRFPEGVESGRVLNANPDGEGENERWWFSFNRHDTKTFWYFDAKEAKNEKLHLLLLGALTGVFFSHLLSDLKEKKRTKRGWVFDIILVMLIIILYVFYMW